MEIFHFQAFKTLYRRFFSTNTSGNLKYELIVESAESLLNFSELFWCMYEVNYHIPKYLLMAELSTSNYLFNDIEFGTKMTRY